MKLTARRFGAPCSTPGHSTISRSVPPPAPHSTHQEFKCLLPTLEGKTTPESHALWRLLLTCRGRCHSFLYEVIVTPADRKEEEFTSIRSPWDGTANAVPDASSGRIYYPVVKRKSWRRREGPVNLTKTAHARSHAPVSGRVLRVCVCVRARVFLPAITYTPPTFIINPFRPAGVRSSHARTHTHTRSACPSRPTRRHAHTHAALAPPRLQQRRAATSALYAL